MLPHAEVGSKYQNQAGKKAMLPALAFCGWSGAGKTTLLEALIPRITSRGISVAVVKHDAHGVQLDTPGKDSDRMFRAGAGVCLRGPNEVAWRLPSSAATGFQCCVRNLLRDFDLVLVEGHKQTPLPKVWLESDHHRPIPGNVENVQAVLPWNSDRVDCAEEIVLAHLNETFSLRPVFGGILIGGQSRRMGRPKQLLGMDGIAMVEHVAAALEPSVSDLVLLGGGHTPDSLAGVTQLADVPDGRGPLAGLLSALRWAPFATWIISACDMPFMKSATVAWLARQRTPGAWAVIPQINDRFEPLLAVYEPQAAGLLENLNAADELAPKLLAKHNKVVNPCPELTLQPGWVNVNTQQDLASLAQEVR